MYNHNKAQQSKNRVHISWDILYIRTNIGSGYGLFPESLRPLPKPMLTDRHWYPVVFTLGQLHRQCWRYLSLIYVWKYKSKSLPHLPGQRVNSLWPADLIQCWLIYNWTLRKRFHWYLNLIGPDRYWDHSLFSVKPLFKPMLTYRQLDPLEQTSWKFEPKYYIFTFYKMHSAIFQCSLFLPWGYTWAHEKHFKFVEPAALSMGSWIPSYLMNSIHWINKNVIKSQWTSTQWNKKLFVTRYYNLFRSMQSCIIMTSSNGNRVTGPVARSFDVFCDLCLNKRLSKQSWGWWFETPSRPLCRHCNDKIWHYWNATATHATLHFHARSDKLYQTPQ